MKTFPFSILAFVAVCALSSSAYASSGKEGSSCSCGCSHKSVKAEEKQEKLDDARASLAPVASEKKSRELGRHGSGAMARERILK